MFGPVNHGDGGSPYHAERGRGAQPLLALALCCASALAAAAAASDGQNDTYRETIIARAHEAWESDNGDTMFIRGDLQLRGTRWRIHADTARVDGKLGKPDRVVVDGSPARILVTPEDDGPPFEGQSRHLVFQPQAKTVKLEGAATIIRGQQSITSESISYELDRRTVAAGARGRVKVVTSAHPDKRK